jgi:uncharacterized protein YjbI with pentapeptide repeats
MPPPDPTPSTRPEAGAAPGPGTLDPETRHERVTLTGDDFTGLAASLVSFRDSVLAKVNLAETRLFRLDCTGVRLEACDLANAVWERALLERTRLTGCRMVGLNLFQALLKQVTFQDCNLSFAQLRRLGGKAIRFQDCDLRGADFEEADLRHAVFQGCDLSEAQFSFAKLAGCDLRGSEIRGLQVRIEDLKGAVVEPVQAVYLSGLMGLKIIP